MTMNFDPNGGPLAPPTDAEIAHRHSFAPSKKSKAIKTLLKILLVLVLVSGLVFGIFLLFIKKDSQQPSTAVSVPLADLPIAKSDVPDATSTKVYENGPMGIKLTYPDTWKALETTDKGVRIESPTFTYTSQDKGDVTGMFRIYIRKGARAVDGKVIGRGVAIRPSEKLVYTQPAPDQRKDTLLSLFGLDTKDNFGFFLIAGNFQLNIGDTLGPNYGNEPDAFIVGGGYSSADLTNDLDTHMVDISVISTSKAYAQAVEILKSLQLH